MASKCLMFILLYYFLFNTSIIGALMQSVDLCGSHSQIDLHALSDASWKAVKKQVDFSHFFLISPCAPFKNPLHTNCTNNYLCHKILSKSEPKYIGYNPINVQEFKNSIRVHFSGPECQDNLNYSINILFSCGNNLGYPEFPLNSFENGCSHYLKWETSAACKGKSLSKSFGLNEMPCYVFDNNDEPRYLNPLILNNSSYKVLSPDQELYINVCTDANFCEENGSACFKNSEQNMETIGSYKRGEIKYHNSSELSFEYIEIIYRSISRSCSNADKMSTTSIRFICPDSLGIDDSTRRVPVLVSNLDCHYQIDWVTDYACPSRQIKSDASECKFGDLSFAGFKNSAYFELKNLTLENNSTDWTILFNICDNVKNCNSPVCLQNKDPSKNKSVGSLKNSMFIKADGHLHLVYTSVNPTCISNSHAKHDRAIIEFVCDESAKFGSPEFLYYQDCTYMIRWRTSHVCSILKPKLSCTYFGDSEKLFDLSLLTRRNDSYVVQRSLHDPKSYYMLSGETIFLLNICDRVPSSKISSACNGSAACLIDNKNNITISLGYFTQPLTYNADLKSLELVYTNGYDSRTKTNVSTKITFHCNSWNGAYNQEEPYLIDYEEKAKQYSIEFNTVAACPIHQIAGKDCVVYDPLINNVYNLNQLKSDHYYTVKTDDERYEFELNVCGPIEGSACGKNVSICQKELIGNRRNFTLGKFSNSLSLFNSNLNMTFTNGTPYNDPNKTPRKSHISFICDVKAGNGHPEYDGERNQSYFFRWYTALACSGSIPIETHCVFENQTHFFDLSPLSFERGNHLVLGKPSDIIYMNLCRPLNKVRDDLLKGCKPNSGICLTQIEGNEKVKHTSLGQPASHPFQGFDHKIYLIYNNGDVCPQDKSRFLTSRVRLECDPDVDRDATITMVDPSRLHISDGDPCTYEFFIQTRFACPKKFSDLKLQNCIYTDPRTNLSANLGELTNQKSDYVLKTEKGISSFSLNMCKSVSSSENCKDSAVCFHENDNSMVSYGKVNDPKVYVEGRNLHLRFTDGTPCDDKLDNRRRAADIELICDPSSHHSKPTLYYYNHCLAKFQWKTSAVCNLAVPSCSIFDESTDDFYSLRALASMSHVWNVTSNSDSFYLINICKPLPSEYNCGASTSSCKCIVQNGKVDCHHSLGKASDHELSIDKERKDLLLTYENGDTCDDEQKSRTQISFRCSHDTGLNGPKLISTNHCTHYFIWETRFACSHNHQQVLTNHFEMSSEYILQDSSIDTVYNFSFLFNSLYNVPENQRNENYVYVFNFTDGIRESNDCSKAAICQTKSQVGSANFYRDIGSIDNYRFSEIGDDLFLTLKSNYSKCGRNPTKTASTQIRFVCSSSAGIGVPKFLFESEDCEYFFEWETNMSCIDMHLMLISFELNTHNKSSTSPLWVLFIMFIISVTLFAGWLTFSNSTKRDDVVFYIRKLFRRTQTPQMPFHYQQVFRMQEMSDGECLTTS